MTLTSTDFQRIQKDKFINFLAKMPKLVNDGADFRQCLTALLEEAKWCYIEDKEYKILAAIHTYLSSK